MTSILSIALLLGIATGMIFANNYSPTDTIENCCDLGYDQHNASAFVYRKKSGVYQFKNFCDKHNYVVSGYCDTVTDRGGWLVILRRKDGSVDFNRLWSDYEYGFGDLTGEFWYGLYSLHCLTNHGHWELRMDYKFPNGTNAFIKYKNFKVGPQSGDYQLSISEFSGNYYNLIELNNNMNFTTRDRDNDRYSRGNCAKWNYAGSNSGGWWYNSCSRLHPTHHYRSTYMIFLVDQQHYNLPFLELKIRNLHCHHKCH